MWFVFALLTMFFWGAADLFYKKGADDEEKHSHLKTSMTVGLIMGIHAVATLIFSDIDYDFRNLYVYLPVSLMYILSMTVGYFGLRYLDLSISSPIQNSSGIVVSVLCLVFLGQRIEGAPAWIAMVLIAGGVLALGFLEKQEEKTMLEEGERKYRIGFVAFFMPIIYCVLDAMGTFLDAYYLDDFASTPLLGATAANFEDVANISYELTFFIVAIILFVYVKIAEGKKTKNLQKNEAEVSKLPSAEDEPGVVEEVSSEKRSVSTKLSRLCAAVLETAGQFVYVRAMSGNGIIAAPMIAAYSIVSIMLSRIFLKEKLPLKQYLAVGVIIIGIIILGVLEGLEG